MIPSRFISEILDHQIKLDNTNNEVIGVIILKKLLESNRTQQFKSCFRVMALCEIRIAKVDDMESILLSKYQQ